MAVADASSAWSGPNDIPFIHLISSSFNASFVLSSTPYLFIITATSYSPGSTSTSGSKSENGSLIAAPAAGLLYITSSSCKIAFACCTSYLFQIHRPYHIVLLYLFHAKRGHRESRRRELRFSDQRT